MQPTQEQIRAMDLFRTGDNLVIEAGAGTGKTSTLVLLAQDAPRRRGQYVAFNKALVTDSAGKFPLSVACNTAHSLAFRAVGSRYKARLDDNERVFGHVLAKRLGVGPQKVTSFRGEERRLSAGFLATHVMKAIAQFCQTADREITARHFPYIDGLDSPDPTTGKRTWRTNNQIAEALLPDARNVWDDLQRPLGAAPFRHEHYLKMWQLADPKIDADFILFDEAQDANPVIAAIVENQRHAQLVYVGDSQQEIYAWTGAVNALASVDAPNRTFLTQSFRFGQAIADEANVVLDKLHADLRLTGNPIIASSVGAVELPRAILTRTNAAGITRLLQLQKLGRQVHFLGGTADVLSFARAADELMSTGHTYHPDLSLFASWAEVEQYVNDQDEDGADLRLMVKLVDQFGTDAIVDGLTKMTPESRADIVISTAHKAKGRQWDTVQIASDFRRDREEGDDRPNPKVDTKPELRLLYVALTRAQRVLDMTALSTVKEID